MQILSIDAWRDGSGWTWNAWYSRGEIDRATFEALGSSARKTLAWFRANGYLSAQSAGRCAIEDDQHNIVIVDRKTREPLFAIEYGPEYA